LAQLDFAIKLNDTLDGAYAQCVTDALTLLESALARDGALTHAVSREAESLLLPMRGEAKQYAVICAAHAHIDMNWMWGWQETVALTLATFRTMLALMREYPAFHFSQSQASVYKIVEDYDPGLMEEIKHYIREGRWEVTAAAWVETDKNMPDTESLIRHITETRHYLQKVWGVPPERLQVDFSPDTFGHSAMIPAINAYGQVKYYYHCRGITTEQVLYRWRAPSGDEVLVYREPYWYNSGITAEIGTGLIELTRWSGGLRTGLIVYGVGDHGGGPTRRDVERILQMQDWPVFPEIRFGTFHEFFRLAESVRDGLPVIDHELNAIFSGCYTTQSRIKRGNRRTETALLDAQALGTAAKWYAGFSYPSEQLSRAWRNVLFTHFHDILTGSCVQESREHAMSLYADAMAAAQTVQSNAIRALSDAIDTSMIETDDQIAFTQSEGAGAGFGLSHYAGIPNPERGAGRVRIYHVFNPTVRARRELVELTVWDWPFDRNLAVLTDAEGRALPCQPVDRDLQRYWDHRYFRLLADVSLPPLGYQTVVLNQRAPDHYPTHRLADERVEKVHTDIVLENAFLRAVFHSGSGALISLLDKETGEERIRPGEQAGLHIIQTERATSSAWMIGRHLKSDPVTDTVRVEPLPGALRSGLRVEQRALSSAFTATITLDQGAKALHCQLDICWNEYAKENEPNPVLIYTIPLASGADRFRTDIPAGAIDRPGMPADVPALSYSAALYGSRALALVSDCKYGYRNTNGAMAVTLINTAVRPDPYPERGEHHVNLWIAAESAEEKALKDTASALTHPSVYCSAARHQGTLPATGSLLTADARSTIVSSLDITRDGCPVIRLVETAGEEDVVRLRFPFTPVKAERTDWDECPVSALSVSGDTVQLTLHAREIATVKISGEPPAAPRT
jgi:alpha-mannosidase